jgi:uncharacterized protein (TIGR02646 family)
MIHVPFDPANLPPAQQREFGNWSSLASRAQTRLNEAGPPVSFNSKIWGALKEWLLKNVFHGKCAYCELEIESGFVGDAEHYRPKGAVTENGQRVGNGKGLHPGYYWVCYDWKNLVPSCSRCNAIGGKKTQFPISGSRVFSPQQGLTTDAMDAVEFPLLLHPYDPNPNNLPERHIFFLPDGHVEALPGSERGQSTIDVFDLNREALREKRRKAIASAKNVFANRVSQAIVNNSIGPQLTTAIDGAERDLAHSASEFSAAIRDVLKVVRASLQSQSKNNP